MLPGWLWVGILDTFKYLGTGEPYQINGAAIYGRPHIYLLFMMTRVSFTKNIPHAATLLHWLESDNSYTHMQIYTLGYWSAINKIADKSEYTNTSSAGLVSLDKYLGNPLFYTS